MSEEFNDNDMVSTAERHHQIMKDGDRFFRRLFYGCLMLIVIVAGSVLFLLFKYHPFWRYP